MKLRTFLVVLTATALLATVHPSAKEKKNKKEGGKNSEVVATVNGDPVTKAEWNSIWKADQWHAEEIKRVPNFNSKMAGKPYEDFFFTEEVVNIRAMAVQYKSHLPEMKNSIDAIHEKAMAGEDFAELAKTYSADSTASNGGYLPPFEIHEMTFPFNRIAMKMKAGEISEPFLTIFGYHVVKVEQVLPAGATEGKGKRVAVRHILIRYPSPDPRNEALSLGAAAKVEVLDKKLCKKLVSYCTQES